MKVLVACEFSGVVREAFRLRGHDAWSCDLLPSDNDFQGPHLEGDVRVWLDHPLWRWDLMIAFPPCTYLTAAGIHWNNRIAGRSDKTRDALAFIRELMAAPIPRIAIENPVGVISTHIRKPDQIIQPWQFGHPQSKQTCLWLKNLPLLRSTKVLKPTRLQSNGKSPRWENQTPTGQNKLGPSVDRWKKRSITYQGIADAMADQWGRLTPNVSYVLE